MTVTPDSGSVPWEGVARDPHQPLQPAPPPTEPVRPRRPGLRWLFALAAALIVLVAVAVVVVLATPPANSGTSRLMSYVPASAVAYFELRLDLPGDQRQHALDLLGRFPGLDEAALEEKIDELLAEMAEEGLDWQSDVEPWFDGQFAFALLDLDEQGRQPDYAAIFALRDRISFEAFVERHQLTSELDEADDFAGASVWLGEGPSGETLAVALTADAVVVASDLARLQGALETNAGNAPGLGADARFQSATDQLGREHLGMAYINVAAMADKLEAALEGDELPSGYAQFADQLPGVMTLELRAEANHLLLETRSLPRPGGSLPPVAPNRSTNLAGFFPAGTLAYAEVREAGAGIKQAIGQLSELYGDMGEGLDMPFDVEQFLGVPLEDYLDFLGDAAVGFSSDGTRVSGGLVAQLKDEQAASQRMARLVSSLRAALAFGGDDIPLTISEERHGEVNVTVFSLGRVPGMEMPLSSVSYALADGHLLLGIDDFVTQALDGGPVSSLAQSARYSRVLAAAGAENGGLLFFDVASLRSVFEGLLPAEEAGRYAEIKPYVQPFGQLVISYSSMGDVQLQRMLLFLDE